LRETLRSSRGEQISLPTKKHRKKNPSQKKGDTSGSTGMKDHRSPFRKGTKRPPGEAATDSHHRENIKGKTHRKKSARTNGRINATADQQSRKKKGRKGKKRGGGKLDVCVEGVREGGCICGRNKKGDRERPDWVGGNVGGKAA